MVIFVESINSMEICKLTNKKIKICKLTKLKEAEIIRILRI